MLKTIPFELFKNYRGKVFLLAVTRNTINGLKWVKRDVDAHYLSLSQNLTFKVQLGVTALENFPKDIPYDYSCLAAQDVINRRLCSVCHLYLSSIKEMSSHKQVHKNLQTSENDASPPLESCRRPQRIGARPQKKYLCLFQLQEL